MRDSLSYFSFQLLRHNLYNKGHGIVNIKEPLLLIVKSSSCSSGSGFALFTICPTPYLYNHAGTRKNLD